MDLQNRSELEAYLQTHEGSQLRLLLADLYLRQNMLNEALTVCQKVITEDPRSPYGYFLLALAEIKTKDISAAIEHLKQTVELDYGFLDAYALLIEIGREQLPPGALKACYEKILELNPYDDNARTAAAGISAAADRDILRNIQLPEIKIQETVAQKPVEEAPIPAETEQASEPVETPSPEPETEAPEATVAHSALSEEEAHLGPIERTEEEEPEPNLEIEPEPQLEKENGEDSEPQTEEPERVPEPDTAEETAAEREEAPKPEEPQKTPPSSAAGEGSASALSDMFAKLKTKPLEEVQKENWSLPVVEAPEEEKDQNSLYKKPNVKYTVPLKEQTAAQQDLEEIRRQIQSKPAEEPKATELKKKQSAAAPAEVPDSKSTTEPAPQTGENNNEKVELKIPVPTFTLVEVFKKQKLYDEALQLLDVLEKKSKNPERIEKERTEILKLKLEAE